MYNYQNMFIYLYSLIEVLVVLVPILLSVAFITVIERKVMAAMQRRVGPNMVGFLRCSSTVCRCTKTSGERDHCA